MKRREFGKLVGVACGGVIIGGNVSTERIVNNNLEDGNCIVPHSMMKHKKDGKEAKIIS
mgnify:CR=1 FL=1